MISALGTYYAYYLCSGVGVGILLMLQNLIKGGPWAMDKIDAFTFLMVANFYPIILAMLLNNKKDRW